MNLYRASKFHCNSFNNFLAFNFIIIIQLYSLYFRETIAVSEHARKQPNFTAVAFLQNQIQVEYDVYL